MNHLDFFKIFGFSTTQAANNLSTTAQKSQTNHAHCNATRRCCYKAKSHTSDDGNRRQQRNSSHIETPAAIEGNATNCSSSQSNRRIKRCSRGRPLAALLLIEIALVTLEQQRVSAGALKLTTEAAPSPSSAQVPHLHNLAAADSNNSDNYNYYSNNNRDNHYSRPRRTRRSKRHTNHLYFETHLDDSSEMSEPWHNPCGGSNFAATHAAADEAVVGAQTRIEVRHVLRPLRLSTRHELRTVKEAQHISIDDIEMWSLYKFHYQFLPNVRQSSNVALNRWYRSIQIYIATFDYLGRTQYHWDRSRRHHVSRTTKELNDLLLSARRVLCELGTAITVSNPHEKRRRHHAFRAISRSTMNNLLLLRTKRHEASHGAPVEADTIDLKFAKYSYLHFLDAMWKVMRRYSKQRGQIALHDRSRNDLWQSEEVEEEDASMSIRMLGTSMSSESNSIAVGSSEIMEN